VKAAKEAEAEEEAKAQHAVMEEAGQRGFELPWMMWCAISARLQEVPGLLCGNGTILSAIVLGEMTILASMTLDLFFGHMTILSAYYWVKRPYEKVRSMVADLQVKRQKVEADVAAREKAERDAAVKEEEEREKQEKAAAEAEEAKRLRLQPKPKAGAKPVAAAALSPAAQAAAVKAGRCRFTPG